MIYWLTNLIIRVQSLLLEYKHHLWRVRRNRQLKTTYHESSLESNFHLCCCFGTFFESWHSKWTFRACEFCRKLGILCLPCDYSSRSSWLVMVFSIGSAVRLSAEWLETLNTNSKQSASSWAVAVPLNTVIVIFIDDLMNCHCSWLVSCPIRNICWSIRSHHLQDMLEPANQMSCHLMPWIFRNTICSCSWDTSTTLLSKGRPHAGVTSKRYGLSYLDFCWAAEPLPKHTPGPCVANNLDGSVGCYNSVLRMVGYPSTITKYQVVGMPMMGINMPYPSGLNHHSDSRSFPSSFLQLKSSPARIAILSSSVTHGRRPNASEQPRNSWEKAWIFKHMFKRG